VDRTQDSHPDRMRIIYVVNNLVIGGAERHLTRLLGALYSSDQWDVSVYCLERKGPYLKTMEAMGIEVVGPSTPWSARRVPSALLALYRYLRQERPLIVHAYLIEAGVLGAMAARLARVPFVLTCRRYVHAFRGQQFRRYRVMTAIMDRCSDVVIAVCEAACEQAIHEGTPAEKVIVVENSVPLTREVPPRGNLFNGDPVIGSVGSLHVRKGYRYLIEATPLVLTELPEARFVLVGGGPERPRLEQLAAELGVAGRVQFLGQRTDISDLLPGFDVFVLPSITEGMPNAVLEAMAAGIPVVASRVGGVPEIVQDGETGLLVEPESPSDLACSLVRLGRNAPLRLALRQRALAVVTSRFNPQREVDETEAVYFQLLQQHPRRWSVRSRVESN
jgi:glycosyltransferase involved in cell wall biosynthesis